MVPQHVHHGSHMSGTARHPCVHREIVISVFNVPSMQSRGPVTFVPTDSWRAEERARKDDDHPVWKLDHVQQAHHNEDCDVRASEQPPGGGLRGRRQRAAEQGGEDRPRRRGQHDVLYADPLSALVK